uniref:transmembrane anterior posterior transformation protein 1 homolog n=1 Tax=Monopterus albus TaxID=43700 RepID=UPI0009B31465
MRDLKTLANNTSVQIEYLTAQYTTVKNKVLSDLNNTGPLLGGRIHSQLAKEVVLSLGTALRVTGVLHAILIMVQATTLNVAFNSHNKSLLTIMMSHTMSLIHTDISRLFSSLSLVMIDFGFLQFVEIKGSMFKKFEKNNLFQMSNSDHLWVLFPDVIMVIASEVAVDVVKHAFITKFNDISADGRDFDLSPYAIMMITLKVLNSIILLGTSCVFVRKANMEEKLFDPPPSAVSSC